MSRFEGINFTSFIRTEKTKIRTEVPIIVPSQIPIKQVSPIK